MSFNETVISEMRALFSPKLPLDKLIDNVSQELQQRLEASNVSMLPTCVVNDLSLNTIVKSLEGSGTYLLAIDLGGTTLKMGILSIPQFQMVYHQSLDLPHKVVNLKFFREIASWVCEKTHEFILLKGLSGRLTFLTGITFSFPLNSRNEITTMGKGFTIAEEVTSVSIQEVLEQSFEQVLVKFDFKIQFYGVINDSVAVYLANKASTEEDGISLILGTGINSCFSLPSLEVPSNKKLLEYSQNDVLLINSEIGFLGEKYIPLTQFDPPNSSKDNIPFMPLEYVTSGNWIPLALGNVLTYYGIMPQTPLKLNGQLICQILEDETVNIFQDHQDLVRELTTMMIERGVTYLCAALKGISRFKKNDRQIIQVGYVGSFLRHCKLYQKRVEQISKGSIQLRFLEHSNLIGAAIDTLQHVATSS